MKILATSDLHGNKKLVSCLKDTANKTNADLVLVCGDIGGKRWYGENYSYSSIHDFGEKQRADEAYLDAELSELKAKSRYILGNDDWFESAGWKHYLSALWEIGGITLVPFELVAPTPFDTNREINNNMMAYEMEKLAALNCKWSDTVVVAHMPPLGAGDILYDGSHCGSPAITEFVERYQPKLWLCGHIHEDNSVNSIGSTLVFNCACRHERDVFAAWLIDTETLDFERISVNA